MACSEIENDAEKTEHPSENDLLDLAAGRPSAERATALRAHLLECSACQEILGDLAARSGAGAAPASPPLRRGDTVGRYLVLGVLGAGAMGIVYEAYDPELDRKVALKLVRTEHAEGARGAELRARLLREAQAMARVAHPNVIAVHDVGSFGDRVFVAMERATGGTLGAWLSAEPRSLEAVLEMFGQAGRGLAAAHASGLVHRDFKPDNVLVGSDGRARVTDFGLARATFDDDEGARDDDDVRPGVTTTITRTGAAVGTPAYMAPEQIAGKRPDARADVYGFSVALFEALAGERPFAATTLDELREAIEKGLLREPGRKIPAALHAVLKRGLAAAPEARWQSMSAMLEALEALDRKPRGRTLAALGLLAALALAAAGLAFARSKSDDPCRGAAAGWGSTWDSAARNRVRQAFARTKVPLADMAFASVERALEERKSAWIAMSESACEATNVRKIQSQTLLDRRVSCLDARRRETAALVALLEDADSALVLRAAPSVKALLPLDDCENARALGEAPPVRPENQEKAAAAAEQTASARALRAAGRYDKALDTSEKAVSLARDVEDPRLLAAALFVKGLSLEELMRYPEAEATYHEAAREALGAHDAADAADAWMQLSGIAGYRREQAPEAYLWLGYAEVEIANLGDDKRRRAKLLERRSLVLWSIDARLEEANLAYAESLALSRGLPLSESKRFLEENGPIAFDMGKYDVALRIFEAEIDMLEREKGHDHPEMLEAAENRAEILAIFGRTAEAIAIYHDLLARFPDRAPGYTNHRLAEALRRAGDARAALEEDEKALAAQANDPPEALSLGQPLTGKGLDLLLLGRPKEAILPLSQALAIRTKGKLPTARAETEIALARALWDSGTDKPRALALAESARAAYSEAAARYGSRWFAAESTTIQTWQKTHTP